VVYARGCVHSIPQALHDAIQNNLYTGMDSLRNITPGCGCCINEADYLEEDWQMAFFGGDSNTLLNIKNKYDPNNFFNCWRCVGSTGVDE